MDDLRRRAAKRLSDWHFETEPGMRQIFYFPLSDDRIGLLEVNDQTPPTGSIELFVFAPSEDIPYTTVLAEITPEEYDRLRRDPASLPLPDGWDLSSATIFEAPRRAS